MTAGESRTTAKAAIRALIEDWARAVRAKDADGVMALDAADA
jgi:ketosteroid isomerase-like protein